MNRTALVPFITALGASLALGQTTNHISSDELKRVRLPDVALQSVDWVDHSAQHKNVGTFLQVKGVIGGTIQFELLLPDAWNGNFVMGGGGGFVGTVQNAALDSVYRGYATVGTDTGHQSQAGHLADWAHNNVEAQLNFGYLAVHRTAQVAKALLRAYYGNEARYSYFVGCSRGGGQAMMEAQRYPLDFDGIVAGAPAFDWTGFAATMVSIAKALYPDPQKLDHTVLTKDALKKLQQSIIEQCDAQDGLMDGVIQDPGSVHFDLAKVEGISAEQRRAIDAIYKGARNSRGPISVGYPAGAECDPDQWIAWLVGPIPQMVAKDHVPDLTFSFGTQVFKYFVFNQPDWDYSKYDFSNFEKDTQLAASFLNATNPDLDGFKNRKGKLVIWHGWADPALPAQASADYYHQVQLHDPKAGDYCRLFLVPGCLHCGGGPGAADVDWLSVISDWVEHDKAPDKLIASKKEHGKIVMTRPLFPYPQYAIYSGTGNTNSADSFIAKSKRQ
jgi:feruloyl esterase